MQQSLKAFFFDSDGNFLGEINVTESGKSDKSEWQDGLL